MFDPASGRNIWVAPTRSEREDGTREAPFSSIRQAIETAGPGSVVVLTNGEYEETVSIQERSGLETNPLTIMADPSADSVILKKEWYFYEMSDCIVQGLTFLDTGGTALSVVGTSKRNIFKECLFINCGESVECTLFFGGSGGEFNVIENCQFTRSGTGTNFGVIIAQSCDAEDETSEISSNTIIRSCVFENFSTAILLGSGDEIDEAGNHLVTENLFTDCGEGIRIKAIACDIRDNIFRGCATALVQLAGSECEINNNRFELCTVGMNLTSPDTTVSDNCCIDSPLVVAGVDTLILPTVIASNSFVFTTPVDAITVTGGSMNHGVIISDNLIYNGTLPESIAATFHQNECMDEGSVSFLDLAAGDFRTSRSVGCHTSAAYRIAIEPIPQADVAGFKQDSTEDDDSIPTMDERDLYIKSLFVINEDDMEENPELYRNADDEDDGDDGEFYDYED